MHIKKKRFIGSIRNHFNEMVLYEYDGCVIECNKKELEEMFGKVNKVIFSQRNPKNEFLFEGVVNLANNDEIRFITFNLQYGLVGASFHTELGYSDRRLDELQIV